MSADLSTWVGSVTLANPILTAAGTSGHGAELSAYVDLAALGAVVVKSLSADPWPGNPAPRLKPVRDGMVNSVGLQGPGVAAWLDDDLPLLLALGATVVVSIWGRRVEEFALAAKLLADAPSQVVAVEVNVSCPNLDDGALMFAASPHATAAAIDAAAVANRPRWAKLSPGVDDLGAVARAALAAGAEALTVGNTLPADRLGDDERPQLGGGGGGISGPRLYPAALRAVSEVAAACPGASIVAAGGVRSVADVLGFLSAGAAAVEVGTITFLDPHAPARILADLRRHCDRRSLATISSRQGDHG